MKAQVQINCAMLIKDNAINGGPAEHSHAKTKAMYVCVGKPQLNPCWILITYTEQVRHSYSWLRAAP